MNGKEIIKKLEANGWRLKRVRGSHYMMEKDGSIIPIPVHGSRDIGKGLLAEIERRTGIKSR
ncbi:MAG: type II toxin-antitoxin system HicA family toxin [Gammaproteobacteria bacterium]|nr:type II toxin-antitoxin system HicA family toxin [Gammaproteobacteria bacterium]NNJ85082.1 addiction module toxin, HicA family [Gammaproteobacteria bacterium]